jgi:ATP-dependent exoDNAse (exonuclease V) beta subunit
MTSGMVMSNVPVDAAERARALTCDQSFIVQAPAGSGKTDLLTRRFLKLLAVVDEPEEILAITFTRSATAEMRARVLHDLEKAARQEATEDAERDALARAALQHGEARGWRLLEQPHRLNIETIDSLCLRIAHNQPLLSRMGGGLAPTENARPLYALAARRTLGRLGNAEPMVEEALEHLLALRDNKLQDCVDLIAGMLAQRDLWIRAFPLTRTMSEDDWLVARSELERPLREEVKRVHGEVYRLLMREPLLADELVELANYACGNGYAKIAALAGLQAIPTPELLMREHWHCIASFLLTNDGEWRSPRGINVKVGFPAKDQGQKVRMGNLLTRLSQVTGLREALVAVREAPLPRYEEREWKTLQHIFMLQGQAIAELKVLFAERNTMDFTEIGLAARDVLGSADMSPDALLAMSGNIRHLLVDEFQDTSRSQYDLLRLLIRAWEAEDGRTGFLVGDPMQSVYLFRQAEVELFGRVLQEGLASENHTLQFEPVGLKTNFRSHAGLTTRWNAMFGVVFGSGGEGAIAYSESVSAVEALPDEAVHVYPQVIGSEGETCTPEQRTRAEMAEAEQVLAIIREHEERIRKADAEKGEYRVAVLARARNHLAKIAALLRKEGVPFRAVELETLKERQELVDLMSLVRALLHPMDRVAWLSVLRAPWCGLTMRDLHVLAGGDEKAHKAAPMLELMESHAGQLSEDGAERLKRVSAVLRQALEARFEGAFAGSFSQWVERAWRSLGGPQCLDATALENAETFFKMLDAVAPDGVACLTADFELELERLYAQPDPTVSERAGVQLMTIHKAKGLGFDVVIVPGLERRGGSDRAPLITSLERTRPDTGETEMLAAPIGERGRETDATYAWVRKQRQKRLDEELKRLLYVACTRARRSLHLLGTAELTQSGLKGGDSRSLLATAWPALAADFEAAVAAKRAKVVEFPARAAEALGLELAATGEQATLKLRRLPANADLRPSGENVQFASAGAGGAEPELERPEGSRDARQKGSVVHALLERSSRGLPPEDLNAVARVLLRGLAYFGKRLEDTSEEVVTAVRNSLSDPEGAWILAPQRRGQSEASLTEWTGGALTALRPDRVFVAGATPGSEGDDYLWIIDYKMSVPKGAEDFLERQRELYGPQLARYERALREAEGIDLPVRFGLYYPRFGPHTAKLDWWSPDET